MTAGPIATVWRAGLSLLCKVYRDTHTQHRLPFYDPGTADFIVHTCLDATDVLFRLLFDSKIIYAFVYVIMECCTITHIHTQSSINYPNPNEHIDSV